MATVKIASQQGNNNTIIFHYCVDDITTTDATPTTWYSVLIPQNKDVLLDVNFSARKSDFSATFGGEIQAKFVRDSGNLKIQGSPILSIMTGITGVKPSIVLQANTGTQSVDIIVVGLAATNIVWSSAFFELKYNI